MDVVIVAMLCLSCLILASREDMASGVRGREGGVSSCGTVLLGGTGQAFVEIVQSDELKCASSGRDRCGEAPNGSESSASFSRVLLYIVLEDLFDCDPLGTSGAGTRSIVENL